MANMPDEQVDALVEQIKDIIRPLPDTNDACLVAGVAFFTIMTANEVVLNGAQNWDDVGVRILGMFQEWAKISNFPKIALDS